MTGYCDTCGICIGADFIEKKTVPVGNKELCLNCKAYLDKYGSLRLDKSHGNYHLLRDGRIVKV